MSQKNPFKLEELQKIIYFKLKKKVNLKNKKKRYK